MSLFGSESLGITLDSVARIIQMALTPVFLLTGLATLLNVFSTRLARVTARVDQTITALTAAEPDAVEMLRDQLVDLRRRSLALDTAVILAAAAGAATCMTVLLLFLGAFGNGSVDRVLLWVFGIAITCALGAIAAYAVEMLMAGTGIRAELAHGSRRHFLRHRDDT
jgi:type IV secretory pathway VirB6-like protein